MKLQPRPKFELASGRLVSLILLRVGNTCEGELTQVFASLVPDRKSYHELWRHQRRGTLLLPLPDIDPEPDGLPRKTYVVELRSTPFDPEMDVSALRVVWCSPGHAGSLEKYVELTLRDVSWIDVAVDMKY